MPIIGLQQQQTEVGRIRLGIQVATKNGKKRPSKLATLRFTSPRKTLIDRVAELYGGDVNEWQPPRGNAQWEVITKTKEVPVMVPPQDPAQSQWLELWSAGGCQRRCDGQREHISGGDCLCDPESRLCQMHTRVRVMLEEVPGLGVWRVDTGSYYAALELPGVAALLSQANGIIPGRLILDERTVTRGGETKRFVVPVLDVAEFTPAELLSGKVPELAAARRAAAIDGQQRAAITSSVDYESQLDAARTEEAVRDLYRQAVAAGDMTEDLRAAMRERAAELAEPIEGEVLEPAGRPIERMEPRWPEVVKPGGGS